MFNTRNAGLSLEMEEYFDISISDEISEQTRTVGAIVNGLVQLLERR